MGCFVLIILSSMLILTILRETKHFEKVFQKFPTITQLIPTWSFFAPIPNGHDYYLLYRGISADGKVKRWQMAFDIPDRKPWHAFIWNPNKRLLKGFLDLVLDLLKLAEQVNSRYSIQASIPYLQILNHVDSKKHSKEIEQIQFVILRNSKIQKYTIAFLSDTHPISKKLEEI